MTGERPLRIAFQGEAGSFSDEALQQLWGSEAERLPYRDFADVTAAVAAGVADRGVLPIENTIVGSIAASHDAINAMPSLFAVAETVVAVHHCLLAAHTTTFGAITTYPRLAKNWGWSTGTTMPASSLSMTWWASPIQTRRRRQCAFWRHRRRSGARSRY